MSGVLRHANRYAANERVGIDLASGPALLQRAVTNIMRSLRISYQNSYGAIAHLCGNAHRKKTQRILGGNRSLTASTRLMRIKRQRKARLIVGDAERRADDAPHHMRRSIVTFLNRDKAGHAGSVDQTESTLDKAAFGEAATGPE